MLRLKFILLLLAITSFVYSQEYLHCTIDISESSNYKRLIFGVKDYEVPQEYRFKKVYSPNNTKMEVINKMAKDGWELESLIDDILSFKINSKQSATYLYCYIDMSESSNYKKLNFGVKDYEAPQEYRYKKVYSRNNAKTEVINEMAKEGWELEVNIQDDGNLFFRLNSQQPSAYLYCRVNMSESSNYKKLDFGVQDYQVPQEYRYKKVYSRNNTKAEVINEMAKDGWELEKDAGNILNFRLNKEQPLKLLYCSINMSESSNYKKLDFGVQDYQVPQEYRCKKVYSRNNTKIEVINIMGADGWELDKQEDNTLYFKLNPQYLSKYLYCGINMSESSSYKKLDFGVQDYQVQQKYRLKKVYTRNNTQTEVINEMSKQSWELPREIQFGDELLLFRRKLD